MTTKFAKRHYETVAETLRCNTRNVLNPEAYAAVVSDLKHMFRADNPRFDSERFVEACYPKGK